MDTCLGAVVICPPCTVERMRWLDSRPSQLFREFGIVHGSGAAYDRTPAGLRDRRRGQYERWRQTVRFQMDLIARTCRDAGHVATPQQPRVVQLDLFELVGAS